MTWPTVQLRHVTHFGYGDSLADAVRNVGAVPVFGSNGQVGWHDAANTSGPVIVIGRKGSFGKLQFSHEPAFAIDTTFFVDATQTDADLRWLYYALSTLRLDELSEDVGVPGLSREKAYSQRVPLPPLDEQRAIADYLDRETARIDALIAAKERLTELLRARVAASLQEAIDAFEPCLLTLRRVVAAFVDYRGATPEKTSSGVPLITATNIAGGRLDFDAGEQFVSEETYASWMRRGFPERGDVLLTTEAPLGEVAAVAEPRVALAQRIILLKPNRSRVTPGFLRFSLLSSKVQADLLSRASGSTVWGIRADRLRDVLVPVPTLRDQEQVVELAQKTEAAAQRGTAIISEQVRLLRERRQNLITETVTGRVDAPVAA